MHTHMHFWTPCRVYFCAFHQRCLSSSGTRDLQLGSWALLLFAPYFARGEGEGDPHPAAFCSGAGCFLARSSMLGLWERRCRARGEAGIRVEGSGDLHVGVPPVWPPDSLLLTQWEVGCSEPARPEHLDAAVQGLKAGGQKGGMWSLQ